MALLSTRQALVQSLSSQPAGAFPHVWISVGEGLVAGVYPTASVKFDFGSEVFVYCEQEEKPDEALGKTIASASNEVREVVSEKRRISLIHEAPRWTQTIEIETQDCIYVVGSATRALITGLEVLEDLVPGTLERLSKEKARSKRPVSRAKSDLYDLASQLKYSHQLKNGYWVGTNNKADEALHYVRRAIDLAGLNGKVTVRRARPK